MDILLTKAIFSDGGGYILLTTWSIGTEPFYAQLARATPIQQIVGNGSKGVGLMLHTIRSDHEHDPFPR